MTEIKDTTLIKLESQPVAFKFLSITILVFLTLVFAWAFWANEFIAHKTPVSFTTNEINISKFLRTAAIKNVQIAIVGTSVADKLDTEYFNVPGVANFAIQGGSSMTGLEFIYKEQIVPKFLFIESNYISNPSDSDLVSAASGPSLRQVLLGAIKPLRYLMPKPYFRYSASSEVSINENTLSQMINGPPNDKDISKMIEEGVAEVQNPIFLKAQRDPALQIPRINVIVSKLEAKGTKVYFVYIPLAPSYNVATFFRNHRKAVSGNDAYDCSRCLDLDKMEKVSELRWQDGIHLDDRSAFLVVEELKKYLH